MNEHGEHIVVPPETGGIAQQPTQEELSAIARSYDAQNATRPKTIFIVVLLGLSILAAVFIYLHWFTGKNVQEDLSAVQPELVETDLEQEVVSLEEIDNYSLLDHIFAGTFRDEFDAQITSQAFDIQWKDRGLDFTMQRVYDLGVVSSRDQVVPVEYLGKKIVVVELGVVNTRLTGDPIEINAHRYVATRFEQTDTPAADWREVLLSPGEDATVFVPFLLDRKSIDYFILSGDLRNPFVSSLQTPTASPVLEDQ